MTIINRAAAASSSVQDSGKAVLLADLPFSLRDALGTERRTSNTASDNIEAMARGTALNKPVCTMSRAEKERALKRHYACMKWGWDGGKRLGFEFGTSGPAGSERGRTRGNYVKVANKPVTQP